jgi:hypothetical protein
MGRLAAAKLGPRERGYHGGGARHQSRAPQCEGRSRREPGSSARLGLPRTEVLGRLANAEARVYRKDIDGAVSFCLDGHSVSSSVAARQ